MGNFNWYKAHYEGDSCGGLPRLSAQTRRLLGSSCTGPSFWWGKLNTHLCGPRKPFKERIILHRASLLNQQDAPMLTDHPSASNAQQSLQPPERAKTQCEDCGLQKPRTHLHLWGQRPIPGPPGESFMNQQWMKKASWEEHTSRCDWIIYRTTLVTDQTGWTLFKRKYLSFFLFNFKRHESSVNNGGQLEPAKPLVFVVICQTPSWVKGVELQTDKWAWSSPCSMAVSLQQFWKGPSWERWGFRKEGGIYLSKQHRPSLPGFALQVTAGERAGARVAGRTAGGQVLATAASSHLRVFSSRVILVQSARVVCWSLVLFQVTFYLF